MTPGGQDRAPSRPIPYTRWQPALLQRSLAERPAPARASPAGCEAMAAHTEAPLRVRGHASGDGYEVFDLQEEFELGPRGRRFLLSVDAGHGEMLLLAVGGVTGSPHDAPPRARHGRRGADPLPARPLGRVAQRAGPPAARDRVPPPRRDPRAWRRSRVETPGSTSSAPPPACSAPRPRGRGRRRAVALRAPPPGRPPHRSEGSARDPRAGRRACGTLPVARPRTEGCNLWRQVSASQ